MAELIATQTNSAYSADFTLIDGASKTIFLKDNDVSNSVSFNSIAYIQAKAGTKYVNIGQITDSSPITVLAAPGTFRVYKPATAYAVGVEGS